MKEKQLDLNDFSGKTVHNVGREELRCRSQKSCRILCVQPYWFAVLRTMEKPSKGEGYLEGDMQVRLGRS
jgi:hypothetical protein